MRPKGQSWNHDDLEERRKQRMDLDFEYEGKDESPSLEDDDDEESRWTDEAVEVEVATPPEQLKETLQRALKEAAVPVAEAARGAAPNGQNPRSDVGLGFRPIKDIVADLSKPISPRHIKQRKQGGQTINYIEWHVATRYLDHYSPGWNYEVRSMAVHGERFVIVVRITIPCAEGLVYREATGQEDMKSEGWGDFSSNAEAMALKRAAAKLGLGRDLYEKG